MAGGRDHHHAGDSVASSCCLCENQLATYFESHVDWIYHDAEPGGAPARAKSERPERNRFQQKMTHADIAQAAGTGACDARVQKCTYLSDRRSLYRNSSGLVARPEHETEQRTRATSIQSSSCTQFLAIIVASCCSSCRWPACRHQRGPGSGDASAFDSTRHRRPPRARPNAGPIRSPQGLPGHPSSRRQL